MVRLRVTGLLFAVLFVVTSMEAAVRLPGFFTDNMVLQRDRDVPVWGWADSGEELTVEFAGVKKSVKAGSDGKWMVKLKPMKACSDPAVLTVKGPKNEITVKNVVVGDVWICSGQSNMEWTQDRTINAREEAATADLPMIRHMKVGKTILASASDNLAAGWKVCTPGSVRDFTAVGFYFARKLHGELKVPIGLIGSNWGGTKIEPWIPGFAFNMIPDLKSFADQVALRDPSSEQGKQYNLASIAQIEQWLATARLKVDAGEFLPTLPDVKPADRVDALSPAGIYNAMIHPLVPYGIRGVIWYQGESNGIEGETYFQKKTALIKGWRELWGYDFPFYFVQLANYENPNNDPAGGDGYAKLREAQRKTLTLPNTGMAVVIDIGEARDIHPRNKQDVGLRLAAWALAKDYGKKIVYSGPLYRSMKIDGNKIRVSFDCTGSGLMVAEKKGLAPAAEVTDGKLKRFAVAGADKKWFWADAVIDGDTVVVSSEQVPEPVAVRYAFSMNPEGCNLYNKDGFPASPFRTDDW